MTFLDGFGAVITSDLGKQLADYTRKTYGKCLCAACAVKLEKARRAAEKEKEAAHAPQ